MIWQKLNFLDEIIIVIITIIITFISFSQLRSRIKFWNIFHQRKVIKTNISLESVFSSNESFSENSLQHTSSNQISEMTSFQYLLMGRQLTMPLFVMTLVSTWYGNIFGVTQIAFEHGIYNFITQGFFWYFAYFVFAFFFAEKIHATKAYSISEMISNMFGAKSGKFVAILLFIKTLPISYAIGMGLVLEMIFDISLTQGIITSCFIVAIFGCFGGMKSVVLRDILQFFLMYIAVISVVISSMYQFGSLDFLKQNLPNSYFSVKGNHDYQTMILWIFIAFSSTIVSPVFYQRCLAAKNGIIAKNGVIISVIFWFIFDLCTTIGGMYAKAVMPELSSINGYFLYGLEILPTGLKGIFVAGILATVFSTLDAFSFSSSALISYDMCKSWSINSKLFPIIRTAATIITAILTASMAITFNGKIEDVWIILELYAGVAIMMPIIWKKFCNKSIIKDWQYIFSCVLSVLTVALTHSIIQITSFYLASIIVIISLTIFGYYNRTKIAI